MKKAFISLHLSVFLAGFTGILGRLITLNEGLLVWYRLMIASITLWIIHFLSKKLSKVSVTDTWRILGIGAVVALHWVTFYGSIKYANVSVALVCFSSMGFFTAILEPLMLKTPMRWSEILLGMLSMIGIAVIFHFDEHYKTGIILGVISAVLASVFTIMNRPLMKRNTAEAVTRLELSGGFLFLTILLPVYLTYFPSPELLPSLSDLGWLLILGWACTVWAFTLSLRALEKISAFTVNLSFNLEPVYGILLAFLVYHENEFLGKSFYAGLLLILLSVVLQTMMVYRSRKTANKKEDILS